MTTYDNYDTGYNDYIDLEELNDEFQGINGNYYSDPPRSKKKLSEKQIQQIRQWQEDERKSKSVSRLGFTPYNGIQELRGYDPFTEDLRDREVKSSMADTDMPFGSSRYDKYVLSEEDLYNLEDVRARNQSRFNKIASGLGKMAVIGLTTAADDLIGPIEGIFNIGKQAVRGNIHSAGDVFDAFIQNPASKWILGLNEQAENWMPTYYTNEEKDAHWYDIWYHASFIGDHFLKNAGYMLGAYLGSKAFSIPLSKAFKVNEARNVYRNTAMAMGMEDKTYRDVLKAYNYGKKIGSEAMVTESLVKAAKNARNAELYLKLASTAFGSIGESRMEAITNSDDWFNRNKQNRDLIYESDIEGIQDLIELEHPEFFGQVPIIDTKGDLVGFLKGIIDEEGYQNEYNRKEVELKQKYENDLSELTKQRIDYSNASFGINFLLTYGENLNIFGDAIAGSWSKRTKFNRRIKRTQNELKQRGIARPIDIGLGIIRGPGFEGTQEMFLQATVTHLNRRAGSRFNSYYGDILDKDGLDYQTGFMKNFMNSIKDTYADADEWENFALGAVTALLPLPTKINVRGKTQVDSEGNQVVSDTRSRIVAGGELWDAIRRANKDYRDTEALVKALNDVESDPNRLNQFYNLVKSYRINELQQQALDNNDQKSYKDLEFEKIANMVMLYSDAGLIDYLKELIDLAYTVETPELIQSIRSSMTYTEKQGDNEITKSLFDDMTDEEITSYFLDLKEKLFDKIDRLSKIYNSLNGLYGDFGEDQLQVYNKTLALDIMSIDDREERIKKLSQEKLDWIMEYAEQFKSGINTENLTDEQRKRLDEINEAIQTLTSINQLDIAFSDLGFIRELDDLRQQQFESLQQEYQEVNKLLGVAQLRASEKYKTKRLYNPIRKSSTNPLTLVNDRLQLLQSLAEKINTISSSMSQTNLGLDFATKFKDLFELLGEREYLYNQLAVLSGVGGIELFFEGLEGDVRALLSDYQRQYSKRFYDKFSQTKDITEIPSGLEGVVRSIARQNDDESTGKYLDLYEKYVTGTDSLISNNQLNERQKTDLRSGISLAIMDSSDVNQAQENINKYLKSITDADVKDIVELFENNLKERQQKKKATDSGIADDDKDDQSPKKQDGKYVDWLKKFKTRDAFENWINTFFDLDKLNLDITQGLKQAIAIKLGYDGEGGATIDLFINSVVLTQEGKNSLKQAMLDIYEDINGKTDSSKEEQPKETPKEEPKEEPEEKGEISSSDAINNSNDAVSLIAKGVTESGINENNDLLMNPLNPTPVRMVAEETQEQPYKPVGSIDRNDDLEEDGREIDAWNVNQNTARYFFDSLKDRFKRMLSIFDRSKYLNNTDLLSFDVFTRRLNDDYHVQEFIDSGFLNRVVEHNGGVKNTKVRFVGINDRKFLDYSGSKNEKIISAFMQKTIFVAIEIPESLRKEYESSGFRTTQFTDRSGKTVSMQILGVVTPQATRVAGKSSIYELTEDGSDKQGKVYKDKQFGQFEKYMLDERQRLPKADFVAYDEYTTIAALYPGRIVKQIEGKIGLGERMIKSILTDELRKDPEGEFQIRLYLKDGNFRSIGENLNGTEIPLNTYSLSSKEAIETGRTRDGSIWIMTKEADGNIYHKGARLLSFNRDWYDAHVQDGNPYLNTIRSIIMRMPLVKTIDDVNKVLHDLLSYLYIPEGLKMFIDLKAGYFRIGKSNVSLSSANAVDSIINNILAKGYKFAIGTTSLKDVVDSDIIVTDLAMLHNANASFTISKVVIKDGKSEIQLSEFYEDNDIRSIAVEENSDEANGNVYNIKIVGNKSIPYKLFHVGNRVLRIDTREDITDPYTIEFLKVCRDAEAGKIQSIEQFDGRYKIYFDEYWDDKGMHPIAFAFRKANKKVDVIRITNGSQVALLYALSHEMPIDKDYSELIKQLNQLTGNTRQVKEETLLKKAVKENTGIKEEGQVNIPQITTPKYVLDYPDLEPVQFRIGDNVSFDIYGNDNSLVGSYVGTVAKVSQDGTTVVKLDDNNTIVLSENAILDFFNKAKFDGKIKILGKSVPSDISEGYVDREYFGGNYDFADQKQEQTKQEPKPKKKFVLPKASKTTTQKKTTTDSVALIQQLLDGIKDQDVYKQGQYERIFGETGVFYTENKELNTRKKCIEWLSLQSKQKLISLSDSFMKFKESSQEESLANFDKFLNELQELVHCP